MILYLVRHGQSLYNAEGRIQGQADTPLSELGHQQAAAVARAMADLPIEAIYASPLLRASQTAGHLAQVLELDVRHDPRLKEVDAGLFTNRIRKEILVEYPGAIDHWRSGRLDFAFPQGESRRDVIRRGAEVLRAVCEQGHAHAAVVAHGGLLLAGMKALLDLQSTHPPHELENGSITRLSVDSNGRFELIDLDNTDHLNNPLPLGESGGKAAG
ncbi:MAG: histidine phosphatase family protein [Pirellulales bacterium]|nr:histidine phosphatase family protein [Pirellulales bacterium]